MKVMTILGARPQFIKASAVSRALKRHDDIQEIVLHTGQHFDRNMSDIFFDQLSLPVPNIHLGINGGSHGSMTGRMLMEIESVLLDSRPDLVLVYGDTNSTLAGALAASKIGIPIAHVEAGLRSFNSNMPEEINRILTDNISTYLFCPTSTAMKHLSDEGFGKKNVSCKLVGDVMYDAAKYFSASAVKPNNISEYPEFMLVSIHRAENTDNIHRLKNISNALNELHAAGMNIILPLHPRTRNAMERAGLTFSFSTLNPVGYLEMLWLLKNCSLVMTDSGGLQKEAYFFGKYCITLRDETEWTELVTAGANSLTSSERSEDIFVMATDKFGIHVDMDIALYGDGAASELIVRELIA